VEDDPDVRRAVLRAFRRRHEFVEAPDGETALELARAEDFDIALVDYQLGTGLNGIHVLTALQGQQPDCARLLMTGDPDPRVVRAALDCGAVLRLLNKPFGLQALEDILNVAEDWGGRTSRGKGRLARAVFQECVDGRHLRLAVQSIVTAHPPHRPTAFECLLRSTHPEVRTAPAVIAAVLEGGVVAEFGAQVNRMAAEWATRLPTEALVFVNVHATQLQDPRLAERFVPLLPHARRVVLEITEGADLERVQDWDVAVATLARMGFRYAADDVGAGWNGLRLLAMLDPAFIKVDMSIVRDVHLSTRKQRLVELLGRFASSEGSTLIAEGVESRAEADVLEGCGAQLLQGYYFHRPSLEWPPPG
jgi:EAL domain-containing protein (putative c-di-GMP-specific phosphodiesterase class I)